MSVVGAPATQLIRNRIYSGFRQFLIMCMYLIYLLFASFADGSDIKVTVRNEVWIQELVSTLCIVGSWEVEVMLLAYSETSSTYY